MNLISFKVIYMWAIKEQLDYSLVFNLHCETRSVYFYSQKTGCGYRWPKVLITNTLNMAWLKDRCCQSAWVVDHSSVTFKSATVSFRIKKKTSWHILLLQCSEWIHQEHYGVVRKNCHIQNRLKQPSAK